MRKILVGSIAIMMLFLSATNAFTVSSLALLKNNSTNVATKQTINSDAAKTKNVNKLKAKLRKVQKQYKIVKSNYKKKQRQIAKKTKIYSKKSKQTKHKKLKRRYASWSKKYRLKIKKNNLRFKATRSRYVRQINKLRAQINNLSKMNKPDIGMFLYKPYSNLQPMEQKLGNNLKYFLWYQSISENFNTDLANWLRSNGKTLELAWEPHDPSKAPSDQAEYSLKTIISGNHDKQIYRWANQIKAFGAPVYFRPMSEMNGDWVAWGQTNGNSAGEYKAAWQHIHNIFSAVGATNTVWVWSPNRDGDLASAVQTFSQYYPGDQYVDVIGINGYNWGTMYDTPTWTSSWQTFAQVFYPSYRTYSTLTNKPLMISEMATTDTGGNKATWIKDAFTQININYTRIKVVVWFNVNKETDWRIDSSISSLNAFRKYAF